MTSHSISFDAIPSTTLHLDFTCGLVNKLEGYYSFLYPTLVDDSHHVASGGTVRLSCFPVVLEGGIVIGSCAICAPLKVTHGVGFHTNTSWC